ncbi:hypothetical protein M441DRAFT_190186 [Trichoderma asperellum CBS 433.97]|uniref:Uncharacterized protein n=1 Tax=Trichoderma asperellum (strain ATCC 204424 / CBS 433.97 / NBRC 101777) TaxID=1042311 RepID=A0A2T3ZB22_TRIA4|nr:hypothetical protein M441DRAFT_190186 [Trichoderma asperellum CBS 433.97]PTB41996.1 hypothetical protein M441DRAFT_190186 [Trichoderma asperellum CBS 433.97]
MQCAGLVSIALHRSTTLPCMECAYTIAIPRGGKIATSLYRFAINIHPTSATTRESLSLTKSKYLKRNPSMTQGFDKSHSLRRQLSSRATNCYP